MKIRVNLDAGYVFDMLSILKVKNSFKNDLNSTCDLLEFEDNLINQIGEELFSKILTSLEFQDLYLKNLEIFKAVDKAKNDLVKASYVDKLNYDRWVIKNILQKKFFGEVTSERKIGYD